MTKMWLSVRRPVLKLFDDCRGVAAIEFAMIVPLMLVLFFGTNEFSTGVAVDRKVTLMARTLSDLTSQNISVTDTQLTSFFAAGKSIMTPYSSTPVNSTITELYVDPVTKVARVQWSKGSTPLSGNVAIPTALQVGDTYLIYSQVSYKFIPSVAWFINKLNGITLTDISYTRPRQSKCVDHLPLGAGILPCTPT